MTGFQVTEWSENRIYEVNQEKGEYMPIKQVEKKKEFNVAKIRLERSVPVFTMSQKNSNSSEISMLVFIDPRSYIFPKYKVRTANWGCRIFAREAIQNPNAQRRIPLAKNPKIIFFAYAKRHPLSLV